jgi:hypothetical protein
MIGRHPVGMIHLSEVYHAMRNVSSNTKESLLKYSRAPAAARRRLTNITVKFARKQNMTLTFLQILTRFPWQRNGVFFIVARRQAIRKRLMNTVSTPLPQ